MHSNIPVGWGTRLGGLFSILLLIPPAAQEVIATVENVSLHWTAADKVSLISGAAIAAITIGGRFAQAVVAIVKGK